MAKKYNTHGYTNDPLASRNENGGYDFGRGGIAGFIDDFIGGLFFGDPDASSTIAGELTGYNAQQREFEQQEYMQDKQNEWNSAQQQMKRAKEAGINPLTAASAIAGNGSSGAVSPEPSAAGAAAGGLGAVSGLANAITGGKASLAKAALDKSNKNRTDTLLPDEKRKLQNEADKEFELVGLNKAQRILAASSAEYADENALRDIQMKRVRVQQMSQEYKNLKAQHEQIMEDINVKIAEAKALNKQADYYAALKLKTDEETRWIKADNDFWDANGFDRHANSNDLIISQLIAEGKDPDKYIESWINYQERYSYAVQKGTSRAERSYGTSKSPWEMGDKYLKRFIDWVKGNGEENPDYMFEQMEDIANKLASEHPNWDSNDIYSEMLRLGFTSDDLVAYRSRKANGWN